jgi:hypothetical protein
MVAETGPDHVGRYEVLFSKLRDVLAERADELTAVLRLRDPAKQTRRVAPATPSEAAALLYLPYAPGIQGSTELPNVTEGLLRRGYSETDVRAILGGNWLRYDWQGLGRTIEVLRAAGVSRIVLVGIVPRWNRPLPRILSEHVLADSLHRVPTRLRDGVDLRVHALDLFMAAFARQQSVSYVSPLQILCNDDGCLIRLGDTVGTLVSWDTGHLLDAASIYLFQHVALP